MKKAISIILSICFLFITSIIGQAKATTTEQYITQELRDTLDKYFLLKEEVLKKDCDLDALLESAKVDLDLSLSSELISNEKQRGNGFKRYLTDCNISLDTVKISYNVPSTCILDGNNYIINIYELVEYTWYCQVYSPNIQKSSFGTDHLIVLRLDKNGFVIEKDIYFEDDITGVNNLDRCGEFQKYLSNAPGNILPCTVNANGTTPAHLNISSIVSYATTYTAQSSSTSYQSYNRQYKNYNNAGGDCCNFVSQCLFAGGLAQYSNWYYNNNGTPCSNSSHYATATQSDHSCTYDDTSGSAWISCSNLLSTLPSHYQSTYVAITAPTSSNYITISSFKKGDLFFNLNSDGSPYHVMICTDVSSAAGFILYSGHNYDRNNVSCSQSFFQNNATAKLHIHSYPTSWTNYSSTYHKATCSCGNNTFQQHYANTTGIGHCAAPGCNYYGYIYIGTN